MDVRVGNQREHRSHRQHADDIDVEHQIPPRGLVPPGKVASTSRLGGNATTELAHAIARAVQFRRASPSRGQQQSSGITHELRINTVELQTDQNAEPTDIDMCFAAANMIYSAIGVRIVRGSHQVVQGEQARERLDRQECDDSEQWPGNQQLDDRCEDDHHPLNPEQVQPRDNQGQLPPARASAEAMDIASINREPGTLTAYWVPAIDRADGYAIESEYHVNLPQDREAVFVTPSASLDTFAHELGHVLMHVGHTDLDGSDDDGDGVANEENGEDAAPDNLMARGRDRTGLDLSPQQAARIRASPYVQPVGAATPQTAPVQRHVNGAPNSLANDEIHQMAERGLAGANSALPYLDQIQESFGHHDVSNVRVSSGDAAREASAAMGATAYASGNSVALGEGTDLFTVAHEAAHVIQQRAGVSLSGGVGHDDDVYEQQADDVAAHVVRGDSVEAMFDMVLGQDAAPDSVVQMNRAPTAEPNQEPQGPVPLSRRPEDCPTYEMWMASFRHVQEFRARDTRPQGEPEPEPRRDRRSRVLGDGAAPREEWAANSSPEAPGLVEPQPGDHFIDHPTQDWLSRNLPDELTRTAYQLPADCADVAFILRHVWLVAHRRTEVHQLNNRNVTIGLGIGQDPDHLEQTSPEQRAQQEEQGNERQQGRASAPNRSKGGNPRRLP